jgi:hypothetical protein
MLLTPALGHEYVQCHFAYRILAVRLAEAGFPVLRFEYRGCGNAGGSLDSLRVDDWLADIECASEELARLSGVGAVCLGGIRFGAALAALAAGTAPAADAALLWTPVLNGTRYVAEIEQRHARFATDLPSAGGFTRQPGEILGHRLGPALIRDIVGIDTPMLARGLAAKSVLLFEDQGTGIDDERALLAARCGRFRYRGDETAERWLDRPHQVYLPGKAAAEIAAWMEGMG